MKQEMPKKIVNDAYVKSSEKKDEPEEKSEIKRKLTTSSAGSDEPKKPVVDNSTYNEKNLLKKKNTHNLDAGLVLGDSNSTGPDPNGSL